MINRLHRSAGDFASFGRIAAVEKGLEAHRGTKGQSFWHPRYLTCLPSLFVLVACFVLAGCSANATKTNSSLTPLISLSVSQAPPASLTVGARAPVSATVSNDLANAGVDWVAMCGSAPNCGSFSPSHTASGAASTFTAPLAVPKGNTVSVTALSATDHSKALATSVTVISMVTGVTITQLPPASAPSGSGVTLAASVSGDPSNEGVDWKATCGLLDCTPLGFHSADGAVATFIVPGPLQFPDIIGSTVTLTAFATADHNFSASASFIVTDALSISLATAPPSTMLTNATATVVAVVTNDITNSGVTWSVSCSNAPCGSVSPLQTASGQAAVFTAPPTVPLPNPTPNPVVVLTATSNIASQVRAAANVTIVAPLSVQITKKVPNDLLLLNGTAPLIATVTNDAANAGVDWSVSCGSTVPAACGTFLPAHTSGGGQTMFTAPALVPTGSTVTITAKSTTDPTQSATDNVTIIGGSPNNLLSGQFVLLLNGKNSSNGPYAIGGVISGDGNGHILQGVVDVADASGNAVAAVPILPGTYNLVAGARGQIHLTINPVAVSGGGPFGVNGTGALTLSVVFVSAKHALVTEADSFGSGTGTLDLQDAAALTAFRNGVAGLNGTYSLVLSGVEAASPNPGYFVAGAVKIQSSAETAYIADQSDRGAIKNVPFTTGFSRPLAGATDANGELVLRPLNLGPQLTQFNLDAWLIDTTHFAITDWSDSAFGTPPVIVAGYLTLQPSSPSVSGTYAFTESGATTAGQPQVAGGIFTCGSTGFLDVAPLGGTLTVNQAMTAVCTAPASGRGLITVSGAGFTGISTFAAYPTLDEGLYLIELDGGSAGASGPSGGGVALQQTLPAPVSAASFSGKYASNFSASTALGLESFDGQMVSDGVSTLSGTADVDSFNASPPGGTPSFGATLNGSFTAGANGRFPLALTITPATGQPTPQLTTTNPVCYIVDVNTCLLLGLDAAAPGTGILQLGQTGF